MTTSPTHSSTRSLAWSPVPAPGPISVAEGPRLLAGCSDGPGLRAHRERYDVLPRQKRDHAYSGLVGLLDQTDLRGRGGAAFPFLVKLRTVATTRGRPVLVVNLAEGEPGSAKDQALAMRRPHLVLDGLLAVARATGTGDLHVVVPAERPAVLRAMTAAIAEREEEVAVHVAAGRFVAGQSSAVLELMAGRSGLPVTTWVPSAQRGHRGRPTLVSNAETWAQVGLLALEGLTGLSTTLLTLAGTHGGHHVVEVTEGTSLAEVLGHARALHPALVGGFHGRWLTPSELGSTMVTPATVGAGVVITLAPGECPGAFTAQVVAYLAGQSAGRCGPCRHGLPALADAVAAAGAGTGDLARVAALERQVDGRGACAHPDGTARLVRTLLATYPGCAAGHQDRPCPTTAEDRT